MINPSIPLWKPHPATPAKRPIDGMHVDVAIIGAGITGLTAATLLRERGRSVAVLEDRGVAAGETGHTTAHITEAIDARYHSLKRRFGLDHAKVIAQTLQAAMAGIEAQVRNRSIDCGFRRLPGYLFTEQRGQVSQLKSEASAAKEAGVAAAFVAEVPLPFATRGAVRFENQAQFHPVAYAEGLADSLRDGLFLGVHVDAVEDGQPCTIETNAGRMTAGSVFVATNSPLNDVFASGLKIAAYRSYVLAAPWKGQQPDGLFWDTEDPYHYIRWQDEFVIVGGEDHKVGQESETTECLERLRSWMDARVPGLEPSYRWSGQIIESSDGLPFIGLQAGKSHVYIATGFAGQGMTFGTYGAMLVADLITGAQSDLSTEAAKIFNPSRLAV
ncbi:MAG: FAD-binding oxidoreductase [Thermoanaerobaculia bacterium]